MRNDTEKSRRGRPPSYDRDAALGAIRDAFWDRGFSRTSLDDLAAATGMNRPSLYGAFGDKRAMYLAAIEAVVTEMRSAVTRALGEASLADALRKFYSGAIEAYLTGTSGPRGCLVVCTAAVEATVDSSVRDALARVIAETDIALTARFSRARTDGELGADADPIALARIATAILHSIALRARAGEQRIALEQIAVDAAQLLGR